MAPNQFTVASIPSQLSLPDNQPLFLIQRSLAAGWDHPERSMDIRSYLRKQWADWAGGAVYAAWHAAGWRMGSNHHPARLIDDSVLYSIMPLAHLNSSLRSLLLVIINHWYYTSNPTSFSIIGGINYSMALLRLQIAYLLILMIMHCPVIEF